VECAKCVHFVGSNYICVYVAVECAKCVNFVGSNYICVYVAVECAKCVNFVGYNYICVYVAVECAKCVNFFCSNYMFVYVAVDSAKRKVIFYHPFSTNVKFWKDLVKFEAGRMSIYPLIMPSELRAFCCNKPCGLSTR
jgi:hypothetical protein